MAETPAQFYIEQWRHIRKKEDTWEYIREIMADIRTSSPQVKGKWKGIHIIELSKEQKKVDWEVDDEWARKALKNLN